MNYEELKNKYPLIRDIQSQDQARKWLDILPPDAQEALVLQWSLPPKATNEKVNNYEQNNKEENKDEKGEEEGEHGGGHGGGVGNVGGDKKEEDKKNENVGNKEEKPKNDSGTTDQSQESQNKLQEYISLEKKPPQNEEEADRFLQKHAEDEIPADEVGKFEKQTGQKLAFEEVRSTPPITRITAIISSIKKAPQKIKEYLGLHQLNDEALPNIQDKENKIRKKISKKWELIQEQFPETKDFKTEEEFKKWASKLSSEQKKSLSEKWGNSNIFPDSAFAYKKKSEQESLSKKTPNLIFKLYTQFFHPKPNTSAITKQGKTDQDYEKQFNELPTAQQKSFLRNEKKRHKRRKLKGKKRPTSYDEKFEKMYGYLHNLKNTPKKYAAKAVANQEYNKSQKKYNPIWAAIVTEALAKIITPPPPDQLNLETEMSIQDEPNQTPRSSTSSSQNSSFRQQLHNMSTQNNNHQNSWRSSKYRKVAKKLRKKGKKVTEKAVRKVAKRGALSIARMLLINPRNCCFWAGCLMVGLTIVIIIFAVLIVVVII